MTDVQASDQAMAVINETNQYLLDAEKAKAQAQKLEQEGKANAVQKEAEIRVQQAAAQETARQKVTLAELEEKELIARREVLKAEKIRSAMGDLGNAISFAYIAKHYFGKSQSWLTQRLNGSVVNGKTARFNKTELIQFQNAIHDLGRKLSAIAFL